MKTEGRRAKQPVFSGVLRIWAARALALKTGFYSAILVYSTHYPKPEALLGTNPPSDKLLHLVAYGVLGLLAASTLWAYGGWSRRNAVWLALALAAAGILDEVTQPMFNRAADPIDWVYDCLGLAAGILAVAGLAMLNSLAWARGSR